MLTKSQQLFWENIPSKFYFCSNIMYFYPYYLIELNLKKNFATQELYLF
jgi:hypothetical protein